MICEEITVPGKGNLALARFTGLADLANYAEGTPDNAREDFCVGFAGASLETAIDRARTGNPALVARSDAMLRRMEAINPPAHAFETQRAVVGGVPSVPDFLSGNPVNMRLRRRVQNQAAPVSVIMDRAVSGGVSQGTIERRGVAVLALVRALSAVRPVTLHVIWGSCGSGKSFVAAVPIDTAPLDLARAAWALAAPEMQRQTCFNAMFRHVGHRSHVGWCFMDNKWQLDHLGATIAPALGATDALIVPGAFRGTEFDTDADAADWVRATVQALSE